VRGEKRREERREKRVERRENGEGPGARAMD